MTVGFESTATDLLKQSGLTDQAKNVLAQAGLPSEALDIVGSASKVFSGKGSLTDKLGAAAKYAQTLVNQIGGPAAQIGSLATAPVMKLLGISPSAVGSVAGAAGTGIGTALLGPLGGAVGGFVGETVVGGINDLVTTSPDEREARRRNDDIKRINTFAVGQGLAPLDGSHHWMRDLNKWYTLFYAGRIMISQGKKGGATTKWWFKNGKLVRVSEAEYARLRPQWVNPNSKVLDITSTSMSGRFLVAIAPVEARVVKLKQVKDALERAQRATQAQESRDRAQEKRITQLVDKRIEALTKKSPTTAPAAKKKPASKPASKPAALSVEQKKYEKWLLS